MYTNCTYTTPLQKLYNDQLFYWKVTKPLQLQYGRGSSAIYRPPNIPPRTSRKPYFVKNSPIMCEPMNLDSSFS